MGEGYGRNEGAGAIPNSYQNPRDRAAEKTRYGFDVRHSTVINFLYEVPLIPMFQEMPGGTSSAAGRPTASCSCERGCRSR